MFTDAHQHFYRTLITTYCKILPLAFTDNTDSFSSTLEVELSDYIVMGNCNTD